MSKENVISTFRMKTNELFHPINEVYADNFEDTVYYYINSMLEEDYPAIEIVDVVLVGSRSRGIENKDSDMDFAFEYVGEMHEDELFNILNSNNFKILGINIDINPIRREETGTLEEYLPKAEHYLQEKKQMMTKELINRCKNIVNTHGYPIIGDGFVSFPEEYDDVFTKDELKSLEKILLSQKGLISLKKVTKPKPKYIPEPVSTGPKL